MNYPNDVLIGIQTWFRKLSKDGRYARSNLRSLLGKKIERLSEPDTLHAAQNVLLDLRSWLRLLDGTSAKTYLINKVRNRTRDLLLATQCAITRCSYSLSEGRKVKDGRSIP